jgi:hypothetical protein
MSFSHRSFIVIATGCLVAFAASNAAAQIGMQQPGMGQVGTGAGQTGGGRTGGVGQTGGGRTGGGQTGGITRGGMGQPETAADGQISRSPDRMFSDVGEQAGLGRTGMGGIGGMGGMRGMGGLGGLGAFGASPFGAGGAAAQPPSIRTRLRADIQTPALAPLVTDARAERHINNVPLERRVNGFAVSITNGVATIVGQAPNERERRMAELVLRLEPGVRQINNQIIVAP